jgi:hypothetical protein
MATAIIAKDGGSDFAFRIDGKKKVWRLPAFSSVPAGIALDLTDAGDDEKATLVLSSYIRSIHPGLFDYTNPDCITSEQLGGIVKAWIESSGITPGESQASPS